jgi:hypothetical protein
MQGTNTAWLLYVAAIGCPKSSLPTNQRCVAWHNSEDLVSQNCLLTGFSNLVIYLCPFVCLFYWGAGVHDWPTRCSTTWDSVPGKRRPGRGVDHLPQSCGGVKNEWSHTSIPLQCFMVWCLRVGTYLHLRCLLFGVPFTVSPSTVYS